MTFQEQLPKEIERKFLVQKNKLPKNLDEFPHDKIVQFYAEISKEREVRFREKGEKYFKTTKTGEGKIRTEEEVESNREEFAENYANRVGNAIEKIRYKIPYEDSTIELDIYEGDLENFISAEMEFDSEGSSDNFITPEWFGTEVTEDSNYRNKNLALKGLPEKESTEIPAKKEIPVYELEKGIGMLVDTIKEKKDKSSNSIIVEIAGGSASGKTSAVSSMVRKVFSSESVVLSMDDYYRGKTFMNSPEGSGLNWDQPEALNLELLQRHLSDLKLGKSIEKPVYDMGISEPVSTEKVEPSKIIIIEGLFALNDAIKDEGDVKAFVDIGTHGRILRRLLRDIERTGQKPADILNYFSEIVEPMHEKYIQNTKENADIVIKNEYSPAIEAERSGLHEVQLKFKADLSEDALRKLGVDKIAQTSQIDKYCNPKDRNLMETGEILRIREESGSRTLTYKGPKLESEFRKRAKFEFEINEEIENKFLSIYGDKVKTVIKNRNLYQMDGVVFSLDQVSKIDNDDIEELGNYIEIRSTDENSEKINNVITKLGLDTKDGIKESYFEM
jgi:uridine kinase